MRLHHDEERSHPLETITRQGHRRRRPRYAIEGQPARCPICNQVMILYVSARGPKYHCGCDEKNGSNGNGH
jgi:hypothetical protein